MQKNRHTYDIPPDEWESSVHITCDCGWRASTSRRAEDKAEMISFATEALLFHLTKDPQHQGPVLGICDRCRRRTWHAATVGGVCEWDASNGHCGGTFAPVERRSLGDD